VSRPIVLVAGKDPTTTTGGHPSYVRAHARAAALAGFSPHVFAVAPRAGREETDFGTLHRIATPVRPIRRLMAVGHAPFLTAGIARFLREFRDLPGRRLVHGFGAWAYAGAAAARTLAREGIPTVAVASAYTTLEHECRAKLSGVDRTDHGLRSWLRYCAEYLWIRAVADRSERHGYERSRLVLVNYESVARLLGDAYGLQTEIRRLPYASTTAFREMEAGVPLPPPPPPAALAELSPADAPLIVAVSRHDPRKGIDLLLRALAGLAASGVPFRACLVGPGPLLAAHRRLAAELGLGASTAIPGRVDDPFAYLTAADVFVLPSLEEGSGSLSLLEALQARTAVVATRCDGIPEDLIDGENALLVPTGDAAALERALARFLGDAALRSRLAGEARRTYEERFSAGAFAAALKDTYAELGVVP
jgi:glycosyltransferase involved in cell wall biosynthesis